MKRIAGYVLASLVVLGVLAYLIVDYLTAQLYPAQNGVALSRQPNCELAALSALPDVRLASASSEFLPARHCRISGTIEKEINFELLLPPDWNGKFVMGGGGGFAGSVVNMAALYGALQSGYATVGTDTGHAAHPVDASWALDNPERVENFGHRAVHLTASTAKLLIASYYGQASRRNYFMGCSRGGGQALMEAQRYPDDFDGIIAGAPAYNWHIGIGANATRIMQTQFPDPANLDQALITPVDRALLAKTYLAQCDALDGIEDGILNDPRACPFDVASLRCDSPQQTDCLNDQKIDAMQVIYDGPTIDGKHVFPGYPLGGEIADAGMNQWLTGGLAHNDQQGSQGDTGGYPAPIIPNASFGFGSGVMKYLVFNDPDWDYSRYDFENFTADTTEAAAILNATNPDLSAFRERGGKLLMYHGWSDMALTAKGTIKYFEEVMAYDPSAERDIQLYLLPGVGHCFGGAGPSWVNYLTELDHWVETGEAPGALTAQWMRWFVLPQGSRPVCPYPALAIYDGQGDSRTAESFHCAVP